MTSDAIQLSHISKSSFGRTSIYAARAPRFHDPAPDVAVMKEYIEGLRTISELVSMKNSVLLLREEEGVKAYALTLDISYTVSTNKKVESYRWIDCDVLQACLSQPVPDSPVIEIVGKVNSSQFIHLLRGRTEAELLEFAVAQYAKQRTDAQRINYLDEPLLWPIPGEGFYQIVETVEKVSAVLTPLEAHEVPRYDVYDVHSFLRLTPPVLFHTSNIAIKGNGMVIFLTSGTDAASIKRAYQKTHKPFPQAFVSLENDKMYWVTDNTVQGPHDLTPIVNPVTYHHAATQLENEVAKLRNPD